MASAEAEAAQNEQAVLSLTGEFAKESDPGDQTWQDLYSELEIQGEYLSAPGQNLLVVQLAQHRYIVTRPEERL
jgi:hypothetical protein